MCPLRVCFPVLCKFWQLYGRVNGDLLQEGLCHTQVCCPQSPSCCGRPLLTRTSAGDVQTQSWLSLRGFSGFWCTEGLFVPSECLSLVWVLILNTICLAGLLLCPWTWGIFFGGIQHSPVDWCSAASCNFGVLAEEDECTSFYPTIFLCHQTPLSIGVFQARILILELVAMPSSRGSSQTRDRTSLSCIAGRFFTTEPWRKPYDFI